MATGKSLTDAENDRVRSAIKELVAKHGSQSKLAPLLGVSQPALSAILSGKTGAGFALAKRVAQLKGVTIDELLLFAALDGLSGDPEYDRALEELGRVAREVFGELPSNGKVGLEDATRIAEAAKKFAQVVNETSKRRLPKEELERLRQLRTEGDGNEQ